MKEPVAYGIDFGTTNSAIAAAYSDGTVEVLGGATQLLQSLIYLHRNENRLVGEQAIEAYTYTGSARTACSQCELVEWAGGQSYTDCKTFTSSGGCLDARLLAQIKADVADPAFSSTHSWGIDFEIQDLASIVISRLKQDADAALGVSVRRATVGHPVRFAGADGPEFRDRQALGRSRLIEAGRRAGFSESVSLMEESRAAVAADDVDDGTLLCLDFGGGTFDVAVVEIASNTATVLALEGIAVGGEEFDSKIFDHFVAPVIRLDAEFLQLDGQTRSLPASVRRGLRSLSGVNRLVTDNTVPAVSGMFAGGGNDAVLDQVSAIVNGGVAWPLFNAIQSAKHELSRESRSSIRVSTALLNLDIPVDRSSFEELIAADLRRVALCFEDALEDAGVLPERVDFVALTGGSSQIPAFRHLVRERLPGAAEVRLDPFTSVVQGLAQHAYEEWCRA
jgi:hypothetical chaperone protein